MMLSGCAFTEAPAITVTNRLLAKMREVICILNFDNVMDLEFFVLRKMCELSKEAGVMDFNA